MKPLRIALIAVLLAVACAVTPLSPAEDIPDNPIITIEQFLVATCPETNGIRVWKTESADERRVVKLSLQSVHSDRNVLLIQLIIIEPEGIMEYRIADLDIDGTVEYFAMFANGNPTEPKPELIEDIIINIVSYVLFAISQGESC